MSDIVLTVEGLHGLALVNQVDVEDAIQAWLEKEKRDGQNVPEHLVPHIYTDVNHAFFDGKQGIVYVYKDGKFGLPGLKVSIPETLRD